MSKLILVTNPGSASRKYALYDGSECLANLHFEYEGDKVVCAAKSPAGKTKLYPDISDVAEAAGECEAILRQVGALAEGQKIELVAARLLVASSYFDHDMLVDDQVLAQAEIAKDRSPLHTATHLNEINFFKQKFPNLPVVAISDNAFHATKPIEAFRYGVSIDLQKKLDLGRFGYHGISVSSIVEIMKRESILPSKLIVCHLGSGASVSAVRDGISVDNSMGYTPLEGMMMATRSGNIDPAAVLAIKRELNLSDEELESYLNKKAGFLGMTSKSDDMRIVLEDEENGDEQASEAMKTYIYRLRKVVGEMAAAMNGVDAIVFTATVGERSDEVRQRLCQELSYLGFELDDIKNQQADEASTYLDLAKTGTKPIYMIRTDETGEMARRALLVLG